MGILADLPFPAQDVIDQAQALFSTSFKSHIFLKSITILEGTHARVRPPPYLGLSLACLGAATSQLHSLQGVAQAQEQRESVCTRYLARDLCISGQTLWGVMLEVDNREARLIESILAVRPGRLLSCTFCKLEVWLTTLREPYMLHMECLVPTEAFGTLRGQLSLVQLQWHGGLVFIMKTLHLHRTTSLPNPLGPIIGMCTRHEAHSRINN